VDRKQVMAIMFDELQILDSPLDVALVVSLNGTRTTRLRLCQTGHHVVP